ncbi:LOB domain-containing 16 [Olea europaea subsp. europaea]|uniref:LOB domain-containing 16 n=1 Tax=Olea europaea subsp. europaea TaxID=158383 RepID=A0A8S0UD98_OLEEU|nr:LOB domain-containing 16 [Olea europaea subsp. europaea]
MATGTGTGTGTGTPCGACKFLRRKCAADCIFAPYFCSEQGPARFAAIHKVFGASNVSKLLLHIPVADRCEAVVTIAYEAQARIRDPVYGCVSHIFALQQQVSYLQAQLMQVKAQLAQNLIESRNQENQWPGCNINGGMASSFQNIPTNYMNSSSISPQSSLDSIDHHHGNISMQDFESIRDEVTLQPYCSKKRHSQTDLSELQALALRMMKH